MRRLSGLHVASCSAPGVFVTRAASAGPLDAPAPSGALAAAANSSPRITSASLRPSGDSASCCAPSPEPVETRSTVGVAEAPRNVIASAFGAPPAASTRHSPKSRSNTSVRPSSATLGQSSRPFVNVVSARGAPAARPFSIGCAHRFSAPDRSLMK